MIVALLAAGTTLHVSAAASLHESFSMIAQMFERSHPGVKVELNFAGSQQLASQIDEGLPCDVFASADARNLGRVPLAGPAKVFARNLLVIIGAPRTRLDLKSLANVHTLVLAAPQVPAGSYAQQAIEKAARDYGSAWAAKMKAATASLEPDVRAGLAKVELREADAGLVYATDARSAGRKVASVPIPGRYQPRIEYPIGVPKSAQRASLAGEFVRLVLSPSGQRTLRTFGFAPP